MRTVYIGRVTNAGWEDIRKNAKRASYTSPAVTLFDPAGRVMDSGKLELNGYIVIDSAYVDLILYCMDTGEVVELVDDPDDETWTPY